MRLYCEEGSEDWLMMLMTRVLGVSENNIVSAPLRFAHDRVQWTLQEVKDYENEAKKALWSPNIHAYCEM